MAQDEGIIPNRPKSVLIVHPKNLKAGKSFGLRHIFKVLTVALYLGGYIVGGYSKHNWPKERAETWEQKFFMISKTTEKYIQNIYAVVLCATQSEWVFLQRVTTNTGDAFVGVEKMIKNVFVSSFFLT